MWAGKEEKGKIDKISRNVKENQRKLGLKKLESRQERLIQNGKKVGKRRQILSYTLKVRKTFKRK